MIFFQNQLPTLGTYSLLGLIALAVLLVPLYWRFVPAGRRREAHILAAVLILFWFVPKQAPALLLALVWVILSVRRLRAIYEKGGGAETARGKADAPSRRSGSAAKGRPVSNWIVFLHAFPLLAVFVCMKFNLIALIGYSYLLVKSLHLLIEAGRQRRFPYHIVDIAHYLLFIPAFFSGPIDRLPRFRETAAPRLTRPEAIEGLYRIGRGVIRKFVFADALFLWYQGRRMDLVHLSHWQVWLVYNAFFVYVFFDFSGYTDIAIGAGRLYGWRLCENFHYPFIARNISQFWRSWHMSLTFWLQDYIFTPVARWFTLHLKGTPQTRVILATGPAAIFTMAACGLWHYIDPRMALWGILQGVGLLSGILYGEALKKMGLGDFHKKISVSYLYRFVCAFLVIEFNVLVIPLLTDPLSRSWPLMQYMLGLIHILPLH